MIYAMSQPVMKHKRVFEVHANAGHFHSDAKPDPPGELPESSVDLRPKGERFKFHKKPRPRRGVCGMK